MFKRHRKKMLSKCIDALTYTEQAEARRDIRLNIDQSIEIWWYLGQQQNLLNLFTFSSKIHCYVLSSHPKSWYCEPSNISRVTRQSTDVSIIPISMIATPTIEKTWTQFLRHPVAQTDGSLQSMYKYWLILWLEDHKTNRIPSCKQ